LYSSAQIRANELHVTLSEDWSLRFAPRPTQPKDPYPLHTAAIVVISLHWQLATGNWLLLMDRIATLNEILTENPKDAFARYGLAMEYSKQGDFDRALAEFSILLENHPDYTAGYFMAAQTLARAERKEDAKKMLTDGIASARRTGNLHAQSEMEAMLAELQQN
jgi:tetratricopeptide (TPR) repeat protein